MSSLSTAPSESSRASGSCGRGIGRRLIEAALDAADAAGFERIELTVIAGNTRAMRLYEAVGFEHEGVMRAAMRFGNGDYRDSLLMARLSPAFANRQTGQPNR